MEQNIFIVVLQIATAGLLGAIVGAVIGAVVSNWLQNRSSTIAKKREIIWRIVGHSHVLTPNAINKGVPTEPLFSALNEAFLVFHKDKDVCDTLAMMRNAKDPTQHICPLVRAMAKASRIRIRFDDEFIKKPFAFNL